MSAAKRQNIALPNSFTETQYTWNEKKCVTKHNWLKRFFESNNTCNCNWSLVTKTFTDHLEKDFTVKNNYRRDEVPWWLQNADLTLFSSSLNTFFVSKIKNTSLQMQWYKNVSTLVSFVMVQCIFTIGEITIQSYYY